jgi:hypothetical protein
MTAQLLITLTLVFSCLFVPDLHAERASVSVQVSRNLGHINLRGLPRLRFYLGSSRDLVRLGFDFSVIHNVVPSSECEASSEWHVTGLTTFVYINEASDIIWEKPNMQRITFYRKNAYVDIASGWSAKLSSDGFEVTLKRRNAEEWQYKHGWLNNIVSSDGNKIVFKTDREVILEIKKIDHFGNSYCLLEIVYSGYGGIKDIIFSDGRKNVFSWSENQCLSEIDGILCGRISLQYEKKLLKSWTATNKQSDVYVWKECRVPALNIGFGVPPVMVRSDSNFVYDYITKHGVNYIFVRDIAGKFVSETRLTSRGMMQILPNGEILYAKNSVTDNN